MLGFILFGITWVILFFLYHLNKKDNFSINEYLTSRNITLFAFSFIGFVFLSFLLKSIVIALGILGWCILGYLGYKSLNIIKNFFNDF